MLTKKVRKPSPLHHLQSEKLRTQKQMTEKLRMENEITRGDILRKSEVARTFAVIAEAMSTRINSAVELPRAVREDLLREISAWPLALEEATHAQTRLKAATQKEEKAPRKTRNKIEA